MNLPCSTKVRSRRELRMDGITIVVKYDGSPERPLRIAFGRQRSPVRGERETRLSHCSSYYSSSLIIRVGALQLRLPQDRTHA